MEDKQICILGITYTIKEVEYISRDYIADGEINYSTDEIKLVKSLPKDRKEQTLMHELVHAVFEGLGMNELNSNEQLVQTLSAVLYQLFKSQIIFS